MAVVETGRYTDKGQPIYKAAPTQTDIRREASEQRVQTFGSGGQKLSDTGRVEVNVQGEKKWVTPEKALDISSDKAKIAEAEGKIARREKLEQTIKARYEKEAEKAKEPTVSKLKTQEPKPKRDFVSMAGDPFEQGISKSERRIEPAPIRTQPFISKREDPFDQGIQTSTRKEPVIISNKFELSAGDPFGQGIGTSARVSKKLPFTPIDTFKELKQSQAKLAASPTGFKLIDKKLVLQTGTKTIKGPRGEVEVPKGTSLIDFSVIPESFSGVMAANPFLAVKTISAGYKGVKAGLQTVDYIGNIIRGTGPVKAISSSGAVGRFGVKVVTYGLETYATVKAIDIASEAIAPRVQGVSKRELKDIYAAGSRAEFATGFKPKESSSLLGKIGRGTEAFFVGGIGFYAEPFASKAAKESYALTVTQQATELGFTPEQISATEKRGEFLRQAKGISRWIGFTQAEAFANIVGGEEVALAKAAGKMTVARTTSKGKEIFKFINWKQAFKAKAIPGAVEGSIAAGVTTEVIYPNAPFLPSVKTEELSPAYDSLTDPTFETKRIDITEEKFSELTGKASPLGILPEKTNIIYNIIGKPTSTETSVLTAEGIETTTTTTTPKGEVVLSQTKEAEQARTNILAGEFVYKGKQKKFIPGKVLAVVGGSGVGILSAGAFGIVENLFTGKVGSKVVSGTGYALDIPEAPGDILTSTVTSELGRTIPITTYQPIRGFASTASTFGSFTSTDSKSKKGTGLTSRQTGYTNALSTTSTNIKSRVNIDIMNLADANVMNNVNTNVNTLTRTKSDVILKTTADVGVFSNVNTDIMNQVKTDVKSDVFSNVNTNVNVFTPKLPLLFLPLDFFGGRGGYRRRGRKKKSFAHTPDFIASVLNQYGPAPREGQLFTGQERRYKIRGKGFVTPMPHGGSEGIFGLIRRQLGR